MSLQQVFDQQIDRAISLLEEMLLRPDYDILYDVMAMSKFKLAVYHSESGRIEKKNLFTSSPNRNHSLKRLNLNLHSTFL